MLEDEVEPNTAVQRLVEAVRAGRAPDNVAAVAVDVDFVVDVDVDTDDTLLTATVEAAVDVTAPRTRGPGVAMPIDPTAVPSEALTTEETGDQ